MSDLTQALSSHIKNNGVHATIADFLQHDQNKAVVTNWFRGYRKYEAARSGLKRKFASIHSSIYPKSKSSKNADFDAESLFVEANVRNKIEQEGLKALQDSTHNARKKLKTRGAGSSRDCESQDVPEQEDSLGSRLTRYVEHCQGMSREKGFFLPEHLPKILATKGIILLKKDQADADLVKEVGEEALSTFIQDIKSQYLDSSIKLADTLYSQLASILRGINSQSNREHIKREIYKLAAEAEDDDLKVIDIIINCLNKLPGLVKTSAVGEMELTTNFLDPIFSPLFHQPAKNRYFLWANRQEANTENLRPDGIMSYIKQRQTNVTLGFCEVKPEDCHDVDLLANDLLRLAFLSKNVSCRKANKFSICVQAFGYNTVFYLLHEVSDGLMVMLEAFSFEVPKQISQLSNLFSEADMLKRIAHLYEHKCQGYYEYQVNSVSSPGHFNNIINPKKRKEREDEVYVPV